jgi:hypothetical protein
MRARAPGLAPGGLRVRAESRPPHPRLLLHQRRWSLRFDLKHLLKDEVPVYDDVFKVSVGIGWRF